MLYVWYESLITSYNLTNQEPANRTLHLIEEASDGPNVPPIDLHPEDAPEDLQHRPQLLSRCLAAWRDNEDDMGSLSCLIPPCGFLTLQVLDISMSEGEPTGRIEIHDGQCHVSANVDPRYIVELKKRSWGKYSLIQIKATTGLHTDLVLVCVIVYYCLFLLFILFQTKFSHPKSIQLVPKRSLVSPDRPLLSLVATADVDQGDQTSPSLANSMIADADLRRVEEQLPAQHPARRLLVSPAEVRKKLSQQQIDDLLQMIGSNDFIRLVFSLYLHILC